MTILITQSFCLFFDFLAGAVGGSSCFVEDEEAVVGFMDVSGTLEEAVEVVAGVWVWPESAGEDAGGVGPGSAGEAVGDVGSESVGEVVGLAGVSVSSL